MTQEQFNTICKILKNGAPALADELISSIAVLINENHELRKKMSNTSDAEEKDCDKEEA